MSMNWYKISQEKYIVDSFMLRSLDDWLYRVIPSEEIDITREKILMWMQSSEKSDVEYAISHGWRRVYDLVIEGQ